MRYKYRYTSERMTDCEGLAIFKNCDNELGKITYEVIDIMRDIVRRREFDTLKEAREYARANKKATDDFMKAFNDVKSARVELRRLNAELRKASAELKRFR